MFGGGILSIQPLNNELVVDLYKSLLFWQGTANVCKLVEEMAAKFARHDSFDGVSVCQHKVFPSKTKVLVLHDKML